MDGLQTLTAFTTASLLLAAMPGPDNLFVLLQSAMHGPRAGITVTLGLCLGVLCHTTAAACGLAALIAADRAILTVVQYVGSIYLLWLAYKAWTAPVGDTAGEAPKLDAGELVRRGLIMNLTNPKVLLFFLAFFPQFIAPGTGHKAAMAQMFLQGFIFVLCTLLVFSLVAWASGTLADFIRTPKMQKVLNKTSSVIFCVLALFAAFSGM